MILIITPCRTDFKRQCDRLEKHFMSPEVKHIDGIHRLLGLKLRVGDKIMWGEQVLDFHSMELDRIIADLRIRAWELQIFIKNQLMGVNITSDIIFNEWNFGEKPKPPKKKKIGR